MLRHQEITSSHSSVQEDEFIDRRPFDPRPWSEPDDLDDLRKASEKGPRLAGNERRCHRPSAYLISRAIDFPTFMREAGTVDAARRAMQRRRILTVTDDDGQARRMAFGELYPEGARLTWPGQRMFGDWTLSSAGRSGTSQLRGGRPSAAWEDSHFARSDVKR